MKHSFRLTIFLSVWLCSYSLVDAQQSNIMDLAGAISYAENNSPSIKDALLRVQDADARIRESTARGLPQLSASGSYTYYFEVPVQPLPEIFQMPGGPTEISFLLQNNVTGAVNLDAMVFDPVYFVALKAARAARTYAQLDLNNQKREVRKTVRDAYLPLLLVKANLDQLDKNIANLEQLFFETQETYKAGFAEQLDVDRLELSLATLRTEQENLSRQYDILLSAFKYTINYPIDQELTVGDELETILVEVGNEAEVGAINYGLRPELTLLEQVIQLNDYNVQVSRSGFIPTLRAVGAYQYQYQGADLSSGFWAPTGFVGLNLSIPIYDGGFKRSQIQRAQIARDQVVVQRETMTRAIKLEVTNARATLQNARDRLADRERNMALAQRIYDTTQVKYREGVGSSIEVSQAEQALYTAQSNRLQALYDLIEAKTALKEALGLQ